MSAIDYLTAGNLSEAYRALSAEIRANPADSKLRIFLFQLLCLRGEWGRALTQLKVIGEMDASALPMVQTYRETIQCENYRSDVFAGRKTPLVFGQPDGWIALLIEALKLLAKGTVEQAASLRAEAFAQAPASGGVADGLAFNWIADADMRLGPILEVIMQGQYYWVPFATISRLDVEPPTDLRDRVWTPVEITWTNGGQVVGFVPTLYPDTAGSGDDALMLGRKTEWRDVGGETYCGVGQRLLATDQGDIPLMDLRKLQLSNEAAHGAA